MKGLVNQAGGLRNFFGDGSDGAFDPSAILAAATAPNGGTVANLWDMNASTVFTTGNLPITSAELLVIDFGSPVLMSSAIFRQASISAGASRSIMFLYSDNGVDYTGSVLGTVSTTVVDLSLTGHTSPHRYWKVYLYGGGSVCTFSTQGVNINYVSGDTQTTKVWNIIYPSALNGPAVVKQFSSLTLPAGYSMTVENPCQGLVVYCQGDAVINGTIDMSNKAGLAPNGNIIPMPITKKAKKTAKTSALLHFNGNVTDDSGRTWTANGSPTYDTTNKKFGSAAISFSGSGQYVDTPASDDFSFGQDDFTIDCWVRPTATGTQRTIFSNAQDSAGDFMGGCQLMLASANKAQFVAYTFGASLFSAFSKSDIPLNTFTHIAVVVENGILRMYINGVLDATVNTTPLVRTTVKPTIGRSGEYAGSYFTGKIDEFRIIKGKAMYTSNFTPPTAEYTYTATYTDEPKTLEKYLQLTSVLQALRGGYGGNGGYGGGNRSGSGRVSGGIGGSGRINQGGFGAGGGAGQQSGYAGMGGSIQFAELGGGFVDISSVAVSFIAINGRDGGGGTNGMRSSGRCYGGGGGGVGSITTTTGGTAPTSGEYAGGFICLIVSGTVSGNGAITANGGNGGNGGDSSTSDDKAGGGGGGGSGGGVIMELYAGQNTFSGTRSVNGGTGGTGGTATGSVGYKGENGGAGSSGGLGTIHIQQVA